MKSLINKKARRWFPNVGLVSLATVLLGRLLGGSTPLSPVLLHPLAHGLAVGRRTDDLLGGRLFDRLLLALLRLDFSHLFDV